MSNDAFDNFVNGDENPMGEIFEVGDTQLELIKITDDNHETIVEHWASGYIGHACRQCRKIYETTEAVLASVWDGKYPMHPDCWQVYGRVNGLIDDQS